MLDLRARLAGRLARHRDRILDRWSSAILEGPGPHYREQSAQDVRGWLSEGLSALIEGLRRGSPEPMVVHARAISEPRFEVGFAIDEVLDALLRLKDAVAPEIEAEMAGDPEGRRAAAAAVDHDLRAAVACFGVSFAEALRDREQRVAVLEERQRLARELHDSISQSLYAAAMYAEAASRQLGAGELSTAGEHAVQAREAAIHALREMRLLIYELRPSALSDFGLAGAIEERLGAVERRCGVQVQLTISEVGPVPERMEEELYGIASEALNNVTKHSDAASVSLSLERLDDGTILLTVRDDGRGFEVNAPRSGGGFGLQGMRERVERLGGRLEVESRPGEGCVVRARVPLART